MSCEELYIFLSGFEECNLFLSAQKKEEILEIHYFVNQQLPLFHYHFCARTLKSCSKDGLPIACFTFPPGHSTGIPAQQSTTDLIVAAFEPAHLS